MIIKTCIWIRLLPIILFNFILSDDPDCKRGIVYPERYPIQYFDPYLVNLEINKGNKISKDEYIEGKRVKHKPLDPGA